jgi:hypothetical protein
MSVNAWQRALIIVVVVAGGVATACSDVLTRQGETGAVASSGTAPAAVGIEMSPSYLTIENRAGLPLVDVTIAIKSMSGLSFTKSIPRLETGAKRDLALSELRGNDGTTFSTQFQRPKQVLLKATDLVGKKYEIEVPWKP